MDMAASVPPLLAQARELMMPAMHEAVDRLSPRIRRVVAYHLGWIDADGNEVSEPGGKAVRPALAYACAQAVGAEPREATPGAIAVELVHNFSLLHDDVMDRDTERRHRPTAWALMGLGEAILAGDALLALAQERLIDPPTPERLKAAAALSEATADMITGQAQDLSFEERDDVDLDECVAMLANKTAALLACSCKLGAILGGGSEQQIEALGAFGHSLGISFQAVDDVLGIWGRPELTGKPAYSDLRQRKKSLPVVAALDAGGPAADEIRRAFGSEGELDGEAVVLLAKLVEDNGGRDRALGVSFDAFEAAMTSLGHARLAEGSLASLRAMAEFITDRDS